MLPGAVGQKPIQQGGRESQRFIVLELSICMQMFRSSLFKDTSTRRSEPSHHLQQLGFFLDGRSAPWRASVSSVDTELNEQMQAGDRGACPKTLRIRLTDDVAGVLRDAVLQLGQHDGLKGQRRHAEEEVPDAVTWNVRGRGGEGSGSRRWGG